MGGRIVQAENLTFLRTMADASVRLIYIDPPFNTGREQALKRITTLRAADGDRTGFGGRQYQTVPLSEKSYNDRFDDYLGFLEPRLKEACRVLTTDGSLYFHIDYREAHYCKILLDGIFGRECFLNEIIWAYDYGARTRKRWPPKHDTIFWYVKDPENYIFNYEDIDRIPYMAPGLVGAEKAARGKPPTDTWWHSIVGTNSRERTGYPTQKPLALLKRIVLASSNPDDTVLDFFAGSGTTGAACLELNREFILVDDNPEANKVMHERFAHFQGIIWE